MSKSAQWSLWHKIQAKIKLRASNTQRMIEAYCQKFYWTVLSTKHICLAAKRVRMRENAITFNEKDRTENGQKHIKHNLSCRSLNYPIHCGTPPVLSGVRTIVFFPCANVLSTYLIWRKIISIVYQVHSGCVVECRICNQEVRGISAGDTSHQGLSLPPTGVGKWVPAAAGKAKAGMAHSDCGWTCGCAG